MCARQVILAGTFCMMYVRDFAGKRFDVRRRVAKLSRPTYNKAR